MKIPVEQTCRWFFFDSNWRHDVVGMVMSEVADTGGRPYTTKRSGQHGSARPDVGPRVRILHVNGMTPCLGQRGLWAGCGEPFAL